MPATVYERLLERYQSGRLPWDDELPPPEIREWVAGRPPGKALDLGCGYGRAAIYLARQGWHVDAVDFIELAVAEARRRAATAGVSVRFHHAAVTDLDFLAGAYDLALDVGCLHSLDEAGLRAYHGQMLRLLSPQATFLLFARLRPETQEDFTAEEAPKGIPEIVVRELFAAGFTLERLAPGLTDTGDGPAWQSAWFWYRRQ